jgi:hypothetical protein
MIISVGVIEEINEGGFVLSIMMERKSPLKRYIGSIVLDKRADSREVSFHLRELANILEQNERV